MKKTLALIILALAVAFAAPAHAQNQAPQPQAAVWAVKAFGCPAAAGVPALLAPQWTAALASVNGNAAETAMVQEWQSYVAYRIAQILAANPQQNVTINIAKPANGNLMIQPIISTSPLGAAGSCPTS